jgi:hypothetical protein
LEVGRIPERDSDERGERVFVAMRERERERERERGEKTECELKK